MSERAPANANANATDVVSAFDPELRQAQKDWSDYLGSRDTQDVRGVIHSAQDGKPKPNPNEMTEDQYFNHQLDSSAADAEKEYGLAGKGLKELAEVIRDAKARGDKAIEIDAREIFDDKFIAVVERNGWEGVTKNKNGKIYDRNKIADARLAYYEGIMNGDEQAAAEKSPSTADLESDDPIKRMKASMDIVNGLRARRDQLTDEEKERLGKMEAVLAEMEATLNGKKVLTPYADRPDREKAFIDQIAKKNGVSREEATQIFADGRSEGESKENGQWPYEKGDDLSKPGFWAAWRSAHETVGNDEWQAMSPEAQKKMFDAFRESWNKQQAVPKQRTDDITQEAGGTTPETGNKENGHLKEILEKYFSDKELETAMNSYAETVAQKRRNGLSSWASKGFVGKLLSKITKGKIVSDETMAENAQSYKEIASTKKREIINAVEAEIEKLRQDLVAKKYELSKLIHDGASKEQIASVQAEISGLTTIINERMDTHDRFNLEATLAEACTLESSIASISEEKAGKPGKITQWFVNGGKLKKTAFFAAGAVLGVGSAVLFPPLGVPTFLAGVSAGAAAAGTGSIMNRNSAGVTNADGITLAQQRRVAGLGLHSSAYESGQMSSEDVVGNIGTVTAETNKENRKRVMRAAGMAALGASAGNAAYNIASGMFVDTASASGDTAVTAHPNEGVLPNDPLRGYEIPGSGSHGGEALVSPEVTVHSGDGYIRVFDNLGIDHPQDFYEKLRDAVGAEGIFKGKDAYFINNSIGGNYGIDAPGKYEFTQKALEWMSSHGVQFH